VNFTVIPKADLAPSSMFSAWFLLRRYGCTHGPSQGAFFGYVVPLLLYFLPAHRVHFQQ
jgi:hypothetical protein